MSGNMEQEGAIRALAALAQGTRLETFRLLVKSEPEGLPAGELARTVGVPQNTMSAHLAVLARADLISGQRHSRSIVYRANLRAFEDLTLFMIEDCCGGTNRLSYPLPRAPRRNPAQERTVVVHVDRA
jgi:DNA-binding transcriptional ArsR family regulator